MEFKCIINNNTLTIKEGDKEIFIGNNGLRMLELKEAIKQLEEK